MPGKWAMRNAGARAATENQPSYDGLHGGGGRRSQPCESRGEWHSHSSGRRVVAASVPTASAPVASALAAEYQPGYDGLPGGAQGLRTIRIDSDQDYDYDQDFVEVDEATKFATKPEGNLQLPKINNLSLF